MSEASEIFFSGNAGRNTLCFRSHDYPTMVKDSELVLLNLESGNMRLFSIFLFH